ncbi:MAG TPA: gluconate 2-dehydrogenase subunit 3 family protein [Magnetospirillum sp.]|nr:gluconate 2-dehydrogenase subunit 3 family protein [Magnetospirillum sp.]
MDAKLERRDFLKAAAAGAAMMSAGSVDAAPRHQAQQQAATAAQPPHRHRNGAAGPARLFLSDAEAAFLTAVVEIMIPADDVGPGGVEAGVVEFLDRQLAGAWGNGARMYLRGPWGEGTPQQGYQLPLTTAQLFRASVPELEALARQNGGKGFAQLPAQDRDKLLAALDSGEAALPTMPGKTFMELLRTSVVEGYFADPAYGGNRAMAAWRMIGFPGARGAYVDEIEAWRGKPFVDEPVSLADLQ